MRLCKICGQPLAMKPKVTYNESINALSQHVFYECSFCQCLQQAISSEPINGSYDDNYYSFTLSYNSTIKGLLRGLRNNAILLAGNRVNRDWAALQSRPDLLALSMAKLTRSSHVLDVGCGAGYLLKDLDYLGFKNLAGLDPYGLDDNVGNTRIRIHRETLEAHQGVYDYILFNHSLEHIADPYLALSEAYRLLRPGGKCIVRVPVYPSYCYSKFQDNWVQLDPARHIYIFSTMSMAILSSRVGFHLSNTYNDSTSFGILGSRALLDGKASRDEIVSSFDLRSVFSRQEISEAALLARKLNNACLGDQSCFLLIKPIYSL